MLALYILAGVLLLTILLLSIPLDLAVDLEFNEQVRTEVRFGWLFGLVWKKLGAGMKKRPVKKAVRKKPKKRQKRFRLSMLKAGKPWRSILRLVKRVLGCIKVRKLNARLRIGLDDPADTGMLCAFLWPVMTPLTSFKSVRFSLEPVFSELALEAELHGAVRVFPIQVLGVLLGFVLTPRNWQILRTMAALK